MHFSIPSAFAALSVIVSLTPYASAFVIDTFSDTGCANSVQSGVNIYDNTCATWPNAFKSFKITTFGGSHQKGYFFAPDNCGSLPGALRSGYVDSTTHDFVLGNCYNFNNAAANAVASYAG